ncbi:uncharacterized protein LOC106417304 [Brassica napus]|uniref:uncharacterized protein LOC106417304 n=1 Tax=Brassica napus TaxID=3708 RepID=UPI0006AAC986|nr:uncharacterized protein LOC106417304 [Brassica napus]
MKDRKELWKSLQDFFDHQKDISLPLARDKWQSLRFQDFDKVMNYNSDVLGIVAKLRYYGETMTESKMLEKTYTTLIKSQISLQQQYRLRGYTEFLDLIVALLIAEKNNELLIKNHMTRPTGSKAFPEANALNAKKPMNENKGFVEPYSIKGKGKVVNFAEHSEGTTDLDASDIANDFDETAIIEA